LKKERRKEKKKEKRGGEALLLKRVQTLMSKDTSSFLPCDGVRDSGLEGLGGKSTSCSFLPFGLGWVGGGQVWCSKGFLLVWLSVLSVSKHTKLTRRGIT
jgi:hypothetical protein